MALKDNLQKIFNADYPGTQSFIDNVVKPVIGDTIHSINRDILSREHALAAQAAQAGIKSITYVCDIDNPDSGIDKIELFDVVINDSVKIERARVNIQRTLRSLVESYTNILILFHYEDPADRSWRFSYVFKESSQAQTTSAKRFTYVFGKNYSARTAAERFEKLANSEKSTKNFIEAFSVEALSKQFFDRYREVYADFVAYMTGFRIRKENSAWVEVQEQNPDPQFETTFNSDAKAARDYIKKMFGRIVFLYFLQRKGWLYDDNGTPNFNYMHDLFEKSNKRADFLDQVLEPLFFHVLNTDKPHRPQEAQALPGSQYIPYLNGGLFQQDDIDPKRCIFPEHLFSQLFEFLNSYNFTIDENDTEDAEVGIDPEMLGRIFESLLEDNKDKGAFYTPKPIVDYMCREAVIAYLQGGEPASEHDKIRQLVEQFNSEGFGLAQRAHLKDKLKDIKICDPAIGSGAFPMGIINLLVKLYRALGVGGDFKYVKRHIMENSIYGVDIEKGAVDIARLRFWLAMIVEEQAPTPLPNLHFKIMQGNSLLESYNGVDLSDLAMIKAPAGHLPLISQKSVDLVQDLNSYYNETDHAKRDKKFQHILNNVRCQIDDKGITLPKGLDPSANDQFFLWHTWFLDVFAKGGFDIVIGNPPYLKEGRVSKEIFAPVKKSPYYQGKMDLWYMFACQGIDMLKPNGHLCFIATNNWVTSDGAKKLRKKINTDAQIIQLCDFKNYMIFESASIQTMIMLFKNSKREVSYQFDLRNLIGTKLEDVVKLLNKDTSPTAQYLKPTYNRREMKGRFITFSDSDDLFKKMETLPSVINIQSTEMAQGIVFPQDFLNKKGQQALGHHKVGDGIFGLTTKELSNLNLPAKEMDLIKPYYTTDEVKRYFTADKVNTQWLIYTDSTYKTESAMDEYPVLKAHLDQFKAIFTSDNKPYGLHRARDNRFFSGAKIICQRKCAKQPKFSYSEGECYLTQTFNIIKTDVVNLKYLTGLLNSKLIAFWLRNRGKMQGENYQLDSEPLRQIPVVVTNAVCQERLAEIVSDIITRISTNANTIIEDLENQIDHIVYHLYDLTYDEVLIVDPATSITRDEYENFKIE